MDVFVDLTANPISVQVTVAELLWARHHLRWIGDIQRDIVSCSIGVSCLLSSSYKVDSWSKLQS